jgi:hypothetical protein
MFIIEAILKIFGQGVQYFKSSWNLFDFTIVCVSIFDILMAIMGAKLLSFLRSGPQIARVLRVMRVSRLFKLMKTKALEGINKIIKTIAFAFPSLMNVLSLLVLLYFIFAVLGVFMFKGSPYEELVSNPEVNFDNFLNAFIVLFRCSTGEDWHRFMYHYSDSFSSPMLGRLYFLFYITLSSFIMLNMFTLVVTQQFEEFYFNTENPVTCFEDISEEFRYTPHPIKISLEKPGTCLPGKQAAPRSERGTLLNFSQCSSRRWATATSKMKMTTQRWKNLTARKFRLLSASKKLPRPFS